MDRAGRLIASPLGRVAVAAAVACLAGCTMCPDPYDYSGPVPNGSAPQNDFRARSNGILPLDAAPRPWPPIVKHPPGGPAVAATTEVRWRREPTLADPAVTAAAEPDRPAEAVGATSVLVAAAEEDPAGATLPAARTIDVVADAEPIEPQAGKLDDEPAAHRARPAVADEPAAEDDVSAASMTEPVSAGAAGTDARAEPPPPVPTATIPPLAETPGWRPRR